MKNGFLHDELKRIFDHVEATTSSKCKFKTWIHGNKKCSSLA